MNEAAFPSGSVTEKYTVSEEERAGEPCLRSRMIGVGSNFDARDARYDLDKREATGTFDTSGSAMNQVPSEKANRGTSIRAGVILGCCGSSVRKS